MPSTSNLPLLSSFPIFAFAACHLKWKSKCCSMFVYFLLNFLSDEPKSIKMTPPRSCINLEPDSIHHLLTLLLVTWHFLLALWEKKKKKKNWFVKFAIMQYEMWLIFIKILFATVSLTLNMLFFNHLLFAVRITLYLKAGDLIILWNYMRFPGRIFKLSFYDE